MTQKQYKKVGVILTVTALTVGILCLTTDVLEETAQSSAHAAEEAALPAFRYEIVQPGKVTLTTELPGRVSAFMVSEVRPQVSGIITERLFTEGADVEAGQVLYQINPAIFEAAYNNAKATLAKAEASERSARLLSARYGKIVKINAVSRQEYDDAVATHSQAIADVEAAKQALETARINLGYAKVTAPVSGRIGRSQVTPGALATQHQTEPLAIIQQLDKVYVDVTHSNSAMLKLRRAFARGELNERNQSSAKARLRLEDGSIYSRLPVTEEDRKNTEEIEGELLFSDVTIEKSTGVVNIRALFDNPDNILLPGMYVRALVEEGSLDNAVLVPQKAVMRDTRGRSYVYVLTREAPLNAEKAANLADDSYYIAMRHVQIDRHHNNMWLLSSGLNSGDRVLMEGWQKVRPGTVITGIESVTHVATGNYEQAR